MNEQVYFISAWTGGNEGTIVEIIHLEYTDSGLYKIITLQ